MEHFIKGQKVRVIADNAIPKSNLNDFIGHTGVVNHAYYNPDGLGNSIRVDMDSIEALKYFTADELELIKEEN
jgi:hypothetical protein